MRLSDAKKKKVLSLVLQTAIGAALVTLVWRANFVQARSHMDYAGMRRLLKAVGVRQLVSGDGMFSGASWSVLIRTLCQTYYAIDCAGWWITGDIRVI